MARQNAQFHLASAPEATAPVFRPFPAMLGWGLLAGVLLGALAGWIIASLLLSGTLVIPGWEQLYSMTPGTFFAFWEGIGVALGILIFGVGTVLAAPVHQRGEDVQ